ncbi:hypothetical protein PROFUN_07199 [Planoprotostelium fungivorum]|uniref:Uncharacterized protein n=1 Tax=Planoprotostelium fungivorum TaxID=1890364 RepID=A0A2P6NMJ5_9EUKA|nr:hypothetical protein PROFUN_07199 [Planoprotostelium fungivorum]
MRRINRLAVGMDFEKTKAGVIETLRPLGFLAEETETYASAMATHEIDSSILTSKLLNHDLLKEIGIKKMGHRVKILSLGKAKISVEEPDYNQKPTEALSLDVALAPTDDNLMSGVGPPHSRVNYRDRGVVAYRSYIPSDVSRWLFGKLFFCSPVTVDSSMESEATEKMMMEEGDDDDDDVSSPVMQRPKLDIVNDLAARAKFIPVRLNDKERHLLRLAEAALNVSDYTGKVDVLGGKRGARSHEQLKEICAILSGLLVASDYSAGQKLIVDRNFADNENFFQSVFEIARRHKIMNPEKMRTEYGKLVYLLMDSALPEIQDLMGFSAVKPVITVHSYLEERKGLSLLQDPNLRLATMAIVDDKRKKRNEIQREIKAKEAAVEHLADKYSNATLKSSDIKLCLRSMGDNASFLIGTRDPVDGMIELLEKYFNPTTPEKGFSLSIQSGHNGARLSHDHARQYAYALQSLHLWREITNDMFRLWILAERDLLDAHNRYRLTNTGQGLNRVQNAPSIGKAMQELLSRTKKSVGDWVGSSVVHLGDHNVPNALMFIDKYTQVPRIINPILIVIKLIDDIAQDEGLAEYIRSTFNGVDMLKKTILTDFFRHAFDGSGADNFYDAGSCIDGRLTSAWNWCEKLPKKKYYPIFKLCGFSGFDGDFR